MVRRVLWCHVPAVPVKSLLSELHVTVFISLIVMLLYQLKSAVYGKP